MRILVTGAGGQLGSELVELVAGRSQHDLLSADSKLLDISEREQVLQVVGEWHPDLILNSAAFTVVDACETEVDRAWAVNALGPRHLAEAAGMVGAHLVHVSTDYVFDGTSPRPYVEWDQTRPLSVYGLSKLGGETEILSALGAATIVRTSWVCGYHGSNMVKTIMRLASQGGTLRFVDDQHGCPTFADDLAEMILKLGVARVPGVFHVTNQGATTWFQFARDVVREVGGDPESVQPISTSDLNPPRPAHRPANSVLDNVALRLGGFGLLPDHRESLARTVARLRAK